MAGAAVGAGAGLAAKVRPLSGYASFKQNKMLKSDDGLPENRPASTAP